MRQYLDLMQDILDNGAVKTDRTGTTIRFKPSPTIFTHIHFDYDTLAKRLRELSFLNSGVRIELVDERENKSDVFEHAGGLAAFVKYLNRTKTPIHETVFAFKSPDGTTVPGATQIVDFESTVWTIGAGGIILRDGVHAAGGYGSAMVWSNGAIYVFGIDGNWWRWTGSGWLRA